MEKFVVSARKYRPNSFSHVLGQTHVTTTLKNAIRTKHLAHAFLFCGPKGVGKTTSARILAKAINCQQLTADIEPCNVCPSCKSFNEHTSFNIYELDAASNNSVEDIRSLVEQIRYPPQNGLYKVYIIDEVHMLSQAAFNAFLKTLEEPPSYVIFILATTEKHKVLPTILSRCQIFDFQRIKPEIIVEQLKNVAEQEHIPYDEEALHLISQKSEGALRDALSMFDVIASFGAGKITYEAALENLHILDYSYYFKFTDAFLQANVQTCLLVYEEIVRLGFDGLYFLEGLLGHFRSLLVSQDPETLLLLEVPPSVQAKYRSQAELTSPSFLLDALQLINQCAVQYKESLNKRFHVELMLIELATKNVASSAAHTGSPKEVSSIVPENKTAETDKSQVSPIKPELAPSKTIEEQEKKSPPKNKEIIEVLQNQELSLTGQEGICEKPEFTVVNEDFEQITDEPRKLKATGYARPLISPAVITSSNSIKKETLQSTIKVPQLAHIKANIDKPKSSDLPDSTITEAIALEITQETVLKYWQAYAQQLKIANKIAAHNLLNQVIELEGNTILIKFSNSIEEHILAEIKEELLNYLRYNLQSVAIDIKAIFTPHISTSKPYTAQEKFRHLVNKNPHLQTLKDQLQLEIID